MKATGKKIKTEKQTEMPVMSSVQLMDKLTAKIMTVSVPEWGCSVRVKKPTSQQLLELQTSLNPENVAEQITESEKAEKFVRACLVDLSAEQFDSMKENLDGIAFLQLMAAVTKVVDFSAGLSQATQKN